MKTIFLFLILSLAALGLLAQPATVVADHDGDGHIAAELGGDDCDDFNPFAYPGAPGTGRNVDNDCNCVIDLDEEWMVMPDLNRDDVISAVDLLGVLEAYGNPGNNVADINTDGVVDRWDVLDLTLYARTNYSGW